MNFVIPHVIDQFAEEAALLWLRRNLVAVAPHTRLSDLTTVDQRLDAHLDGLRVAEADRPGAAWLACVEQLAWNEPAELFPAGILAWESGCAERVFVVLSAAGDSPEKVRSLASSLAWVAEDVAHSPIDRLLGDENTAHRQIGLSAAALLRADPGESLIASIRRSDRAPHARALRAIGELARRDLLPDAQSALTASKAHVRFAAAWSVARLCESDSANEILLSAAKALGPDSERALQLVLRRLPPSQSAMWLHQLALSPAHLRCAVVGAGIVGSPASIPWLLEMMKLPPVARVAGEAFTMMTGLDLVAERCDARRPASFQAGPTEDPRDDNVALDPDEHLPWPDVCRLADWWCKRHHDYEPGARYLGGRPLTEDWLEHVLRYGYQRQRAAAALELALLRPDQPLFNVRAPGYRQQEWLGLRSLLRQGKLA